MRLHHIEPFAPKEPRQGKDLARQTEQIRAAGEIEIGNVHRDRLRPEPIDERTGRSVEHHGNIVPMAVAQPAQLLEYPARSLRRGDDVADFQTGGCAA
jgi:hypothetical protein